MFIYGNRQSLHHLSHSLYENPLELSFKRHFHDDCELLLIVSGEVDYSIDGKHYSLKPYDLLFIPFSTYHFLIPRSNQPYENYVINVNPRLLDQKKINQLFFPPHIINISNDKRLKRMFALLDYYYETYSAEDFEQSTQHLINEIIIYASYQSRAEISSSDSDESLVARITSYIAHNLESELNSEIIAKYLQFSPSYIQNRFSQTMGIGLRHFIHQKKIYAAHADIEDGLSPMEAARKYCYNDYSSFYRQYKKVFGVSPKRGGQP